MTLKDCYLVPLLKNEALEYARKLVDAKINGVDKRAEALERLFEAASEPATERLLTTPLQVTILTALVQQLGRAPRERWNLFSRYFSYTYDREIERQTYASRLLATHRAHIEQIHARVALLLQVEAERDGGASARMPRARLEEVIEAVLSEDGFSETERKELVRDIAVAAEQRLVFLVEPEPGSFGFEIRSFQEFMAAWALTYGRNDVVEARFLQVAKASMFRNVTLFMASRLFSEASPLRDVLSDKVCGFLDNDPDDELSRVTAAGALLALETLEEGAVLSQPKRARALMERATRLLLLPPSSEHARLARAVNSDTAPILMEAIEEAISRVPVRSEIKLHSAWVTLVECTNQGSKSAIRIADQYWDVLEQPSTLINFCTTAGVSLGPWFCEKMELNAEKFSPEKFIGLRGYVSKGKNRNWTTWLLAVFDDEKRWARRNNSIDLNSVLLPMAHAVVESEQLGEPPPAWIPWIAAAKYELAPGAHTLAIALRQIAESVPKESWQMLAWRSTWPLAVCLRCASKPSDLKKYAKSMAAGELGDIEIWREAESNWQHGPNDILNYISTAVVNIPWSAADIKGSPPLLAYPWWRLGAEVGNDTKIPTDLVLGRLNDLFVKEENREVKKWLAEACSFLIQRMGGRKIRTEFQVEEWLKIAPDSIAFFIPQPKFLPRARWLDIIESTPLPNVLRWYVEPERFIGIDPGKLPHSFFLRLAVLSLDMHEGLIGKGPKAIEALLSVFENRNDLTASDAIDIGILKIANGTLHFDRDLDLLNQVLNVAEGQKYLLPSFVKALQHNRLPENRAIALLVKTFARIGPNHPLAGLVIGFLRDALQIRKSGLGEQSVWNRLALSMPYPQAPEPSRFGGGIPSAPIALRAIELQDVGGIHYLKLSLNPPVEEKGQWTVILGPNGVGKTTILRSLALALRNTSDPSIWPKGAFAPSWRLIEKNDSERNIDTKVVIDLNDGTQHATLIRANGSLSFIQVPEQIKPHLFPIFAYGCRRGSALGGATREVDLADTGGPEIATLFEEGADLIHAETWLIHLEGDAQKNRRSRSLFDAITGALVRLLNISKIEVLDRKVWITESGRPKLPFSSLSDGYLTSAGWFLDLLARWTSLAERYDEDIDLNFMDRMTGLVLIDEIDLHLHPRWQIEIITRVRALLPRMSFVVTTHNPLTLVGAQASEIWILSSDDGRVKVDPGVDSPMLLTGGQIYRRYFGIDDIYPSDLGRSLQRYGFLSGYVYRSDCEEAELLELRNELRVAKIDPGWEPVQREILPGTAKPAVTGRKKIARKKAPL